MPMTVPVIVEEDRFPTTQFSSSKKKLYRSPSFAFDRFINHLQENAGFLIIFMMTLLSNPAKLYSFLFSIPYTNQADLAALGALGAGASRETPPPGPLTEKSKPASI